MPSAEIVKHRFCGRHENKPRDMYCFNHNILVCAFCSTTVHKKCNAETLAEACKSVDVPGEMTKFQDYLVELKGYVTAVKAIIDENVTDIENQKTEILTEADDFRLRIIQHANQRFENFKFQLSNSVSKHVLALNSLGQVADEVNAKVMSIIDERKSENELELEEPESFLHLNIHIEKSRTCLNRIETLNQIGSRVDIKHRFPQETLTLLDRNTNFVEFYENITKFKTPVVYREYKCRKRRIGSKRGSRRSFKAEETKQDSPKIEHEEEFEPTQASLLTPIPAASDSDSLDCCFEGLVVANSGNIILADNNNKALKMFSSGGHLMSCLNLKDSPKHVTILNDSEAVVSLVNQQIGFIDITNSRQMHLSRYVPLQCNICGLANYNGNIIYAGIGEPSYLQMIDRGGNALWTVKYGSDGNQLFQRPESLATFSLSGIDTVAVADGEKQSLIILTARTGRDARICDVGEKEPLGLNATDNNLFVCYKSGEIAVWYKDMKQEKCLVSEMSCVEYPCAIAYDKKNRIIYVASKSKNDNACNLLHRYRLV